MRIAETVKEVKDIVKQWKAEGLTVGFVPTMGYLHRGHESLMKLAGENDRVVVSIFVNPIQFGPGEDFDSYPRDFENDCRICEENDVDLVFHPAGSEMYEKDYTTFVDMTGPTEELCGLSRPGHFRGVCTVVNKLFHIVNPDRAYFGQKDAQQLAVIRRMVRDLNMDTEIIGAPIIREEDGLAMSSRNKNLSREERRAAVILSKAVTLGEGLMKAGERDTLCLLERMKSCINTEPLARTDYIKIVDAASMEPVEKADRPVLAAMAVFIGKTRLIDNFIFDSTDVIKERL